MSHPERVEDYLEHIAGAIERAIRYTGSLKSLAALEQDEQAQDAIVRTLTVIGEAAVRIQKATPEFVAARFEVRTERAGFELSQPSACMHARVLLPLPTPGVTGRYSIRSGFEREL